jgi:hypothetical protein
LTLQYRSMSPPGAVSGLFDVRQRYNSVKGEAIRSPVG